MEKRFTIALICILIAGIGVRIAFGGLDDPSHYDEEVYHYQAVELSKGNGFRHEGGELTAWRMPVFPLLLSGIYKLTGPHKRQAQYFLIIIASFSIFAIGVLAREIFESASVGLVAAALYAVLPSSILLSGRYYCEEFSVLLVTVSFLLPVLFRNSSAAAGAIAALASGVIFGLAILTRGYLLFAIVAVPFYLLLSGGRRKAALACLLCSTAVLSAWMIRNHVVIGTFTLSTETAQAIWHGNNAWARGGWNGDWSNPHSEQLTYLESKYPGLYENKTELERADIFRYEVINELASNPGRVGWLVPRKLAIFLYPSVLERIDWLMVLLMPLSLIGFVLAFRRRELRPALWLLVFPIVCVGAVCLITFGDPRFRQPVNFAMAILGAFAIIKLTQAIRARSF